MRFFRRNLASWATTTRSILGLVYNLRTFQEFGVPVSDVLERHGLRLDTVDPTAAIERSQELLILTELIARVRDPALALKLGARFGLTGYGPLSMLLMSCANGYEAIKTGIRYQRVTYLFGEVSFELGETHSALRFDPIAMPEQLRRFVIERDLAGTYKLVRDITAYAGQEARPVEVWLSFDRPPHAGLYEETFGCRIKFSQSYSGLIVRNTDLNQPFPTADATAFELYRSQCDQLMVKYAEATRGLAGRIEKHLELYLYDLPACAAVAETFGMPERTLRRQLGKEGASYQAILDAVRFKKAAHYLRHTSLPMEEIAGRLGYCEAASFNHAFLRWSGITPSKYRSSKVKDE